MYYQRFTLAFVALVVVCLVIIGARRARGLYVEWSEAKRAESARRLAHALNNADPKTRARFASDFKALQEFRAEWPRASFVLIFAVMVLSVNPMKSSLVDTWFAIPEVKRPAGKRDNGETP